MKHLFLRLKNIFRNSQSGQSLMELMVTIGLAAIIIPALLTGFFAARSGRAQGEQRQIATGLVREGQEAARVFREADWVTFAAKSGGTYYPCPQGNTWSFCTGTDPKVPNGFTRTIQIEDVYRDTTTFGIVSEGAANSYNDPSTKKITTTVSWLTPLPSSVTATEYLTRHGDIPFSESGTADAPAGGGADWCNPNAIPAAQVSLAGGLNDVSVAQGNGDVISFVGSGNSANGLTYADIDITDPSSPTAPNPQIAGSVSNNPQIKTNGAFNEVDYGYLATDQHGTNEQGVIVDLAKIVSDPGNSIIGTLDLGKAVNGQSVYVTNNIAYLTADDGNLYTFSLSGGKNGSHSPIGHVTLVGGGSKAYGKKVVVTGSVAYVAVSSTTNQLQMIDVSDPTHPGTPVTVSMGNNKSGKDLFVDSNRLRAYLVTSYASATSPDFFTIDVNPSDAWYKQILNTYITADSMNPTGVVYVSGKKAVIVGTGSDWNYQVIDVSVESVPAAQLSICGQGGMHVSYDIYGVATLFTNASRTYSYIITNDSGYEYKIIEGGTGSGGTGNGVYESATFDAGQDVAFDYFSGTTDPDLAYKIDIEKVDSVTHTCPTTFTNFTAISTGPIPFSGVPYTNPGQCMRYQVINTGTSAKSYTVSVNYSP